MSLDPLGRLINQHALANDVRPDVVACIVIQESNGDTFAWRWEEKFYENQLKGKSRQDLSGYVPAPGSLPSLMDELLQRSCSYGLMQVLGDTARWCGKVTNPYLSVLHDPNRGLEVGCRILSFYLKRAKGDYTEALRLYNGGRSYPKEIMHRIQTKQHHRFFIGDYR